MPIPERGHHPYRRRMRTSLRAALIAILSGLLLVGDLSPTSASALHCAGAPIHYYSLMSSSDGRALAVHPFYPSFSTALAERYDGTSRIQRGLKQRVGATDALLVNRLTGTCLTAQRRVRHADSLHECRTQGWTFVLPSGPDHVETTYGLRNPSTGTDLTVGPDNWAGSPMMLYPDYAVSGSASCWTGTTPVELSRGAAGTSPATPRQGVRQGRPEIPRSSPPPVRPSRTEPPTPS
jgi:hypothetical protein